ncbi:uncharacterized protein LOC131328907 [Rhododendron vialii]|uniref:uncharacterized protein LOC131328907 n=1 Tax=Rhododendron vialii TaxID=182163 RepID=UPI00265E1C8A|nr:uncharacterized protein LOC131328907 [Rhododendron vialii]
MDNPIQQSELHLIQQSELHPPSRFSQEGVTFGAHVDFPYDRTSLSPFSQVPQQYESYNSSTSMGVPANHRIFNQPFQLTQSSQAVPTSMAELLQAPLSQPLDEEIWFNS